MQPSEERITVRMPEAQLESLDALVEAGEYPSRSEAIRQAITALTTDDELIRRETIVPTVDGFAIGERSIPMVVSRGPAVTSVLGPDPSAVQFLEERDDR